MNTVLLTGGLGFIGRHVLAALRAADAQVYLVVRPDRPLPEYARHDSIRPIRADLADGAALRRQLAGLRFDTVLHIGAVRGGAPVPRATYRQVNVEATAILAQLAAEQAATFVFCSSVGVFGAIPEHLPPTDASARQHDNYYHTTKILAEEHLQALSAQGLRTVILRPSITYGVGDFGFPYALIHLVQTGRFLNCAPPVEIAMGDVRTLADAFVRAADADVPSGSAYEMCDRAPVALPELVDFIAQELHGRPYPRFKTLPAFAFRAGEFLAGVARNDLWRARFQLISRSWYYNPEPAARDLRLTLRDTLPNFKYVIDWYKTAVGKGA